MMLHFIYWTLRIDKRLFIIPIRAILLFHIFDFLFDTLNNGFSTWSLHYSNNHFKHLLQRNLIVWLFFVWNILCINCLYLIFKVIIEEYGEDEINDRMLFSCMTLGIKQIILIMIFVTAFSFAFVSGFSLWLFSEIPSNIVLSVLKLPIYHHYQLKLFLLIKKLFKHELVIILRTVFVSGFQLLFFVIQDLQWVKSFSEGFYLIQIYLCLNIVKGWEIQDLIWWKPVAIFRIQKLNYPYNVDETNSSVMYWALNAHKPKKVWCLTLTWVQSMFWF